MKEKIKNVQFIRQQDFLFLFLEKISKELISISFHSDEIRLHNTDTNPRVHLLFYSPKLTHCRLVIHSQNEARVVHKWPKDRNHFVGEKSFVSTQPLLAKNQEYITSKEAMPIKREMWKPENKQPDGVHILTALSYRATDCLWPVHPQGRNFRTPPWPPIPQHLWTHWQKSAQNPL